MATFYLIRHATNDYIGRALAGRLPKVHLNAEGKAQAARLAESLANKGITQVLSSPLERALETAEPLAQRLGLKIEISEEIHEVNFGDWTGRTMQKLESLEAWKLFNSYRSGTRIPNGELMLEIQARFVGKIESLRLNFPNDTFALFSHGDPIKSALAYYLGTPLDLFARIEISLASFSVVELNAWGPRVDCINRIL